MKFVVDIISNTKQYESLMQSINLMKNQNGVENRRI